MEELHHDIRDRIEAALVKNPVVAIFWTSNRCYTPCRNEEHRLNNLTVPVPVFKVPVDTPTPELRDAMRYYHATSIVPSLTVLVSNGHVQPFYDPLFDGEKVDQLLGERADVNRFLTKVVNKVRG